MAVTKGGMPLELARVDAESAGEVVSARVNGWQTERCIAPFNAQCEACAQVEVNAEEIELAVSLVEAMSSTRADSLDVLTDDARQLRRDLIAKAEAGETFTVPERPEIEQGGEVIELIRKGLSDPDALAAAAA